MSELVRLQPGRRRIGLLGGSFNPAHDGHRHISLQALKRLDLDEVWWLVSPQNPLKPTAGMAGMAERVHWARKVAKHPRIRVTGIEAELGTRYTAETLAALAKRYRRASFVWIMGADNLIQIPRWQDWTSIFHTTVIAVFDRPSYALRALSGQAARRFARYRIPERKAAALARRRPPAWVFLHTSLVALSATEIRRRRAQTARGGNRSEEMENSILAQPIQALPEPTRILHLVEASLSDDKAADVAVIDLAEKSTIADYMVIASGTSTRQVGAMAQHLLEKLKQAGVRSLSAEGLSRCDWVLIDGGDVIVHLFRPEVRSFYNLEKMWEAHLPDLGSETGGEAPAGRA